MMMPGRKYDAGNRYRYGFNGQEHSDNVTKGNYTAEFWEYDSRIGRRWNIDPIIKLFESPYGCFSNNPIIIIDPKGDDGKKTSKPPVCYKFKDVVFKLMPMVSKIEGIKNEADRMKYRQAFRDAMDNLNTMDQTPEIDGSARPLSVHNMIRYLEGKGGVDIYSYRSLYGSSTNDQFEVMNVNNRDNILKSMSSFIAFKQAGEYSGVIFDVNSDKSQTNAMTTDFGTAFGSSTVVARGVFNIKINNDGSYQYSGTIYSTFADNYRWHDDRKNAGNAQDGNAKHSQMNLLKVVGAKDFSARAYYFQNLSRAMNGSTYKSKYTDATDNFEHYRQPTGHYSLEAISNMYKLINIFTLTKY